MREYKYYAVESIKELQQLLRQYKKENPKLNFITLRFANNCSKYPNQLELTNTI